MEFQLHPRLRPRGRVLAVLVVLVVTGLFFFGFWAFFSIVGAIHYAIWYPQFELHDVHIRAFNVTPDSPLLTYDMDVLIQARHFSSIRRIERHSYHVQTSHAGLRIGSSKETFHPGRSSTREVLATQRASLLPMGSTLGPLVRTDLNETGRVALQVYIQAEIYTNLFLAMRKRTQLICDVIVSPGSAVGDQVYEKKCCKELPCFEECRDGRSFWCCRPAPNCCLLPPSDPRSTTSICR